MRPRNSHTKNNNAHTSCILYNKWLSVRSVWRCFWTVPCPNAVVSCVQITGRPPNIFKQKNLNVVAASRTLFSISHHALTHIHRPHLIAVTPGDKATPIHGHTHIYLFQNSALPELFICRTQCYNSEFFSFSLFWTTNLLHHNQASSTMSCVTVTLCSGLYSLSWTFKYKGVKGDLVSSLI